MKTCWVEIVSGFSYQYRSERLRNARTWREAQHKATLRYGGRNVSWYVYSETDAAPDIESALQFLSAACDDGEASITDLLLDGCTDPYAKSAHEWMRYSYLVRQRLETVLGEKTDAFLDAIRA